MRILGIEMRGFGPFKDRQWVDFSAFDDSGIFLIGGRTGAGKSTILDGICFALYGSVPRYDGYSGVTRLRSDHCEVEDVTAVTLTFEVDGETYRIVRSPEYNRPKSRGAGITKQAACVELAVLTDSGWEVLETKVPEVAARVAEIVKLDKGQFLQVILLAQNRFQEFLEADSRDRQSLLRTLFGTQRFEQYAEALHVRAQELGGELGRLTRDAERTVTELASELGVEPAWESEDPLSWAAARVASVVELLEAAQTAELQAVNDARAANDELTAARQLASRQQRQREAARRLTELESRADGYLRTKRQLEAAARAAEVRPRLEQVDAAAAALQSARADEAAALGPAGPLPESDLAEFAAGLGRRIGSLAQALDAEDSLLALKQADANAQAALVAHDAATASIGGRRLSLQSQLSELAERESAAKITAGDLTVAQTLIAAAQTARTAALELSEIEREITALKQAELEAFQARTVASGEVDRVLAMQLHGRAALLAQSLVDGEPCSVCGALEHPAPAAFDGEPVSDAQVTEARNTFGRLAAAAERASSALSSAEARAAQQLGVAGGRTVAEIELELEAARARLSGAQTAQELLNGIAEQRAQITERQLQLEDEERTAGATRTRLAQDAALTARAHSDAQTLVERAREGHQSVAMHLSALEQRHAAVEQLISARSSAASAQSALTAATSALTAQLSECGFPDQSGAMAAMLDAERFAALGRAVRAYEDEMTETMAVLGQPDLQNLPEEFADLDELSERAGAADAVRIARTERRVTLDERTKRAQALTTKLQAELESTVELASEFNVVDVLARATRGEAPNQLGIPLESFVLAAELEEIVDAANGRLQTMSQGRYAIEHSDERTRGGKRTGLEIVVYDAHTGSTRSPRSLSGGEKFLASLALALGMAEVVTNRAGGIQLDTLFIDEGFGALDNETLELAMQTLDELRQGGRTVGLISHVEAMKDQIPAKLLVGVADGGWSVIHQAA
jgi:exonuclease SbcC